MKPKLNGKPSPQGAKGAAKPAASPGSTYAPSVPISLYREVVTELQSTKASLESLKNQNQDLFQHNQKLRIEIERVVQSALQLRQAADASGFEPASQRPVFSLAELELQLEKPSPAVNSAPERFSNQSESPEVLYTGQEAQSRRVAASETTSEMNGWWLALTICLIVFTAFGVGFVIVRPLLPSR